MVPEEQQSPEDTQPDSLQGKDRPPASEGLAPPPGASEPASLDPWADSDSEPTTIDIELDTIPAITSGPYDAEANEASIKEESSFGDAPVDQEMAGDSIPRSGADRPTDSREPGEGPIRKVAEADDNEDSGDSEGDTDEGGDGDDSHLKRKKRRKRKVLLPETGRSAQAAMHRKELASRGDLKRIQRAGVKVHGQKVVADDVNKLKSLSVTPQLEGEFIDHYIEPVRIEYYIPKESRFVTETRYLYVPLIDPEPRTDPDDGILRDHIEAEKFVDLLQVLGDYPQFTTLILDSYHETFHMYESLSRTMKEARTDPMRYRTALYMVETLGQHEPTLAALEALGEFQSWNLNWLIRTMNEKGVEFACADYTISYLIKRRNEYWEQNDLPFDERFEILASLFYDQAFPNRGLHIGEEDYFFDIFEKKNFLG